MTGATYRLSPQQTLTVTTAASDTGGEWLEVESTWSGGDKLPPAHFHPAQDERFEILEGELRADLAGSALRLGPGDVLDVPRGTVHAMTATKAGARAVWQTRPALRTEEFFAAMDAAQRRGGSVLDLVPVVRAHAAEVRVMKPPRPIQGTVFAVLALVAKLLGR